MLEEWATSPAPGGYCAGLLARGRATEQVCLNVLWRAVPEVRAAVQFHAVGQPGYEESGYDKYTFDSHAGSFVTHYGAQRRLRHHSHHGSRVVRRIGVVFALAAAS